MFKIFDRICRGCCIEGLIFLFKMFLLVCVVDFFLIVDLEIFIIKKYFYILCVVVLGNLCVVVC